jgi:uncharacterized protein
MILPDLNLLTYAYNTDAPDHSRARTWWEACLSELVPVGLPWVVMLGYVRLMTSRSVLVEPFRPDEAFGHLRSWLERPHVEILHPGRRHLDLLSSLATEAGTAGALTTDLHLAAMAIEVNAELHSNDNDFARFSGLRWVNPLA